MVVKGYVVGVCIFAMRSGGQLESSGGLSWWFWAVLGCPGEGLGEVLGGLGEPLGRSWSDLGATFCTVQLPIDFLIDV